ncbi:jg27064 [Pararge aegeria aegeria]|uniref:Jg27064 protein n=1 Tax=Pararge aegeria aegeria TaxID=348720 RepID=A0A8S4SBF8_9NEOP|nr:jg27064 [Pararge aegeria aegeria]
MYGRIIEYFTKQFDLNILALIQGCGLIEFYLRVALTRAPILNSATPPPSGSTRWLRPPPPAGSAYAMFRRLVYMLAHSFISARLLLVVLIADILPGAVSRLRVPDFDPRRLRYGK